MSARRQRLDGKRMNVVLQKIIDGRVDQPVPGHRRYSSKRFRHDPYPKMTLPARGAGVACVQVTLIRHAELGGRKAALQSFAKALRSIGYDPAHDVGGAASCTGFVLPLSHSTCGNMKSMVAGVIPYTLKWTQVLSVKFRAT